MTEDTKTKKLSKAEQDKLDQAEALKVQVLATLELQNTAYDAKGFDQQSIFVTNYSIFTTEIKVLFEENSFFNLFFDQAILKKSTITQNIVSHSYAVGSGFNFQTKPGIFSISYALGKFNDTNFNLSSAKIHFGFINLF